MSGNKDFITAQALSEILNLSVDTIWRYTRENKIPYIELGSKQYRYKLSDVMNTLTASVQEKACATETDPTKKYTYQDYLKLPEEPAFHYEVLDGQLIKEPSPNVKHQRTCLRLVRMLQDYFWKFDPRGEVFIAPLDVTFHDTTVVQPDILFVSGEQNKIVKETRIDGPPTLVVEVISPSSNRRDRLKKLQIYQKAQVLHYWLVNPEEKTLECFVLHNGPYALIATGMDDEVVKHPVFPEMLIDLQSLW